MPATSINRKVLSVTQLNRNAKAALEMALPSVWVEGELSNMSRPSSGHWYFTLKDSGAQVRCAMFRGRNFGVKFKPDNGEKVLVKANVSLYEGRGDYQLIVDHIEQAGAGDLHLQFEQIKAKLQAEGLFDAERKRPLPPWPTKIAVVTSPSGAVIRDILHVLKRRYAAVPVVVCPTPVQGQDAALQIVKAIDQANKYSGADIIIVARGGGSIEDLWPFNEELVARCIAASKLPVVSAVGHETDFTISDFVADCRAPTPSAAAEMVSPNKADLLAHFSQLEKRLRRAIDQQLAVLQHQIKSLSLRLRHPKDIMLQRAQKLDELEMRLQRALKNSFATKNDCLHQLQLRLKNQSPKKRVAEQQRHLELTRQKLASAINNLILRKQTKLEKCVAVMQTLNPLNTLQRGYAIVKTSKGQVVQNSQHVKLGDELEVNLRQGQLQVKVQGNNDNNQA